MDQIEIKGKVNTAICYARVVEEEAIHQSAIMCAPTTSQYAAVTALRRCDADIEAMRSEYDMRRRFLVSSFSQNSSLERPVFRMEGKA